MSTIDIENKTQTTQYRLKLDPELRRHQTRLSPKTLNIYLENMSSQISRILTDGFQEIAVDFIKNDFDQTSAKIVISPGRK